VHSGKIVEIINSTQSQLYCHISHYHVDAKSKSDILKLVKNITLLADTDCSHAVLFKKIYPWYKKRIKRLCYNLGATKPLEAEKTLDVVALGTYHIFSLEWNYYRYSDSIIATGFCTLHPDRLLAAHELGDEKYLIHVYPFREYRKKRSLLKHFNISQKKYFSINIKQLMAKSRYIIPGIEITGIPSTIAFEGLSYGCKILTTNELIHLWPNEMRELICVSRSFSRDDVSMASLNDRTDAQHLSNKYQMLINSIKIENLLTIKEILNEERI